MKANKIVPIVTVGSVLLTAIVLFAALILPRLLGGALVGDKTHHFGTVEAGTSVTHVFRLRNETRMPMYIDRDKTTCKCLEHTLSSQGIDPGASVEVTATLTPKKAGPATGDVLLQLGSVGTIRLTVSADVVAASETPPAPDGGM